MSKSDIVITIRTYGDGWQASIPVDGTSLGTLPGLSGIASPGGPWIGAFGVNPVEALEELYRRIGAIVLPTLQPNGDGTKEGS